jgi:hypothetical protein
MGRAFGVAQSAIAEAEVILKCAPELADQVLPKTETFDSAYSKALSAAPANAFEFAVDQPVFLIRRRLCLGVVGVAPVTRKSPGTFRTADAAPNAVHAEAAMSEPVTAARADRRHRSRQQHQNQPSRR